MVGTRPGLMGVAVLHVGWVRRYGTADVITHHPDMVVMTVKVLTFKICAVRKYRAQVRG